VLVATDGGIPMSDFDERIQEVLEKHACHFKTTGMGFNTTISKEDYSLQSLSAIKTIIKESLPKKMPKSNEVAHYVRGRNETIDEIHKRLGI